MCCRTFIFLDLKNDSHVYLNAPDHADPDKLLKLYVDWYNKDFLDMFDPGDPINENDFKYLGYHCPLDFYDDYKKEYDVNTLTFEMVREACREN